MAEKKTSGAKKTTGAKKAAGAKKEVAKKKTTAVSSSFAERARATRKLAENTRDDYGTNQTFISLCQTGARALKEEEDTLYIDGLKPRQYYIQSMKKVLGNKLRVVPLKFLSVYNELAPIKGKPNAQPKFVGVWHRQDAEKYDLRLGSYFDRELPNGNILQPVTWVLCYLPDFPEIKNVVLTFKSTGQKIAKAWRKEIDSRSRPAHETVYVLSSSVEKNDADQSWYSVKPMFEGYVFELEEDGTPTDVLDYAETVLDLAEAYSKAYVSGTLIQRRAEAGERNVSPGRELQAPDDFEGEGDEDEGFDDDFDDDLDDDDLDF